jgi:hypothetical protein
MTDQTLDRAPPTRSDRLAYAALGLGALALFGAAALLWSREGVRVFVDVLMAGLSACF